MIKINFLLLLIISIFSINFDFHNFHDNLENCEIHNHSIIECEDCQYIDNIKNNLIDNSNDYICKNNFNATVFIFSDFINLNNLVLNKLSRAPPSIS